MPVACLSAVASARPNAVSLLAAPRRFASPHPPACFVSASLFPPTTKIKRDPDATAESFATHPVWAASPPSASPQARPIGVVAKRLPQSRVVIRREFEFGRSDDSDVSLFFRFAQKQKPANKVEFVTVLLRCHAGLFLQLTQIMISLFHGRHEFRGRRRQKWHW